MKKRTFKHIDFEGELEGTNISLKIHDLTCQGTEIKTNQTIISTKFLDKLGKVFEMGQTE